VGNLTSMLLVGPEGPLEMPIRVVLRYRSMAGVANAVAEIALACGLADQSHLTKLFRRLVGSTPAVWRREQRAAAIEAINGPFRDGLAAAPSRPARAAHSRIQY
jgi:AraC-like DNA-binding protein